MEFKIATPKSNYFVVYIIASEVAFHTIFSSLHVNICHDSIYSSNKMAYGRKNMNACSHCHHNKRFASIKAFSQYLCPFKCSYQMSTYNIITHKQVTESLIMQNQLI
jgi:hypothetical protein